MTVSEMLPRILPPQLRLLHRAEDGASYIRSDGLSVIISLEEHRGSQWVHVSCARKDRLPGWEDMRWLKNQFIGRENKAIQVLPPESEYVNIHQFCLHLWRCLDADWLPDFTRWSKSL